MTTISRASARLRRTFDYPSSDDDDNSSIDPRQAAMDEEEQDALIRKLTEQNASVNERTRLGLLLVCLVVSLPYLPAFFRARTRLAALLALTSLGATAWMLHRLPPGVTDIGVVDGWVRGGGGRGEGGGGGGGGGGTRHGLLLQQQRQQRQQRQQQQQIGHKTPLERWLPYLNVGLCVLAAVLGAIAGGADGNGDGGGDGFAFGPVGMGYLPAAVYVLVLLSKALMGSVDPEGELTALRYDYKGA